MILIRSALVSLLFVVFVTGCASIPSRVARRHAALFDCSEQDVTVREIDRNGWEGTGNYVANGCGARAAYYCDGTNCVQDGSVVRTDAPAQTAPQAQTERQAQ